MKGMKIIAAIASMFLMTSTIAFGNPPNSGENNGRNCVENCRQHQGGSGGNSGNGGSGSASSVSTAGAIAGAGAVSGSTSGASANPVAYANGSNGGQQAQSSNTGDIRSYSLSGASVGSPAEGTCAANASFFFGLATFPVTLDSCVALNEALFLVKLDKTQAAIERLCQLESIGKTSLCPKKTAANDQPNWSPQ